MVVMLDEELSTKTAKVGDRFRVIVLHDILDGNCIAISQGTTGYGEVTFSTNKGGFGKPGILGIALRYLELADKRVALDGRYREEGKNSNGAAAATWFAVGIFAGVVQGKAGVIPKGRELRARTGEDISYVLRATPPAAPIQQSDTITTISVATEGASIETPTSSAPKTDAEQKLPQT